MTNKANFKGEIFPFLGRIWVYFTCSNLHVSTYKHATYPKVIFEELPLPKT